MALEVLVVDDEADIRELVSGVLEDEGYAVRTAADSSSALDAIEDRRPSLVLLDVWLQGSRMDGLQMLQEVKRRDPTLPVLMISGHGNLDTAVAAVREGAIDFIEKPFDDEALLSAIRCALARHVEVFAELVERLAIVCMKHVQQPPAARIGESLEQRVVVAAVCHV